MAILPQNNNDDSVHNLHSEPSQKLSQLAHSIQQIRMDNDPSVPTSKLRIVIVLDEKCSVSLDFLNIVRKQICEFLPFLNKDTVVSAFELVGYTFWQALNGAERRMLRPCIRQLIKEGLPMCLEETQPSYQATYRFLGLNQH
jgi:hypothetical protein